MAHLDDALCCLSLKDSQMLETRSATVFPHSLQRFWMAAFPLLHLVSSWPFVCGRLLSLLPRQVSWHSWMAQSPQGWWAGSTNFFLNPHISPRDQIYFQIATGWQVLFYNFSTIIKISVRMDVPEIVKIQCRKLKLTLLYFPILEEAVSVSFSRIILVSLKHQDNNVNPKNAERK